MTGDFVLIDDAGGGRALLFAAAREWILARDPGEVQSAFARLDRAVAGGAHVAGAFSYELGYLFEPRLAPLLPKERSAPLIACGIFEAPRILSAAGLAECLGAGQADIVRTDPAWDFAEFARAFLRVRDYIAAGDAYQVNLSFPLAVTIAGDPLALYRDLRHAARARHGALLRFGATHLLSFSPELFFSRDGDALRTRPMKGTIARGSDPASDEAAIHALRADAKQRAENLMIVDLLRNDLSRLALPGTVRVDDLFTVETYPTLHTMTSCISARVPRETSLSEIVRALFPCGSVTGAPKIRAMEIIRELETSPRGFYCGAIGHMGQDGGAFNVAIRTLAVQDGRAVFNIGSGIVYDSDARAEYEECLLKSRFLTEAPFGLVETMRLDNGHVALLARHLARLKSSAFALGFACDEAALRAELARLPARGIHRLRLELSRDGKISQQTGAFSPWPATVRLALSQRRVHSADPLLRHKTTRRALYDSEYERRPEATDEVLFLNERGELADGSRTTIFAERAGQWFTPPLSSGALDGVLRRELLENGGRQVSERVLTLADLESADALYVGNALRGLARAALVSHEKAKAGLPTEAAEYSAARLR